MQAKVKAQSLCLRGHHWCPSCGVVAVENKYGLCFGCERKWWKVYDSCVGAGMAEGIARSKADCSYPGRYQKYS